MATYIEGAIIDHLQAGTAVAAICSTRIYWEKAPDRPTLPYVVLSSIADPHQAMYFDPDDVLTKSGQRLIQFTCVAEKNTDAANLQKEVMTKLRWTSGTVASYTIITIAIENMRSRFDSETQIYECDVDAVVEYYET
jgi:hypothetical protein